MDALKRAVDLMDESAVKLSSARGRYFYFYHVKIHPFHTITFTAP